MAKAKYESMKVVELREECKKRGLTVYKHKGACTKAKLVEKLIADDELKTSLLEEESSEDDEWETIEREEMEEQKRKRLEQEKASEQSKANRKVVVVRKENIENNIARKFNYEKMEVGSFVAFRYNEKMQTAKVIEVDKEKRSVLTETKFGTRFYVPFERIIWVKLNADEWWPKAVFMELKGGEKVTWEGAENDPKAHGNKRKCKKII